MKTVCVILNYNDAKTVGMLVQGIRSYACLDRIVIVDNASTDNSWERLLMLQDEKVSVIRAGDNGGYGAGNNLGIRFAIKRFEAAYVLVCNPDVMFSEECVSQMVRIAKNHSDVGVVSAKMADSVYTDWKNGWPLRCFWGDLLAMGPISRRIFNSVLNYPDSYLSGKKAACVDVVHGSMLLINAKAFKECGGYDERIFLYQEEAVLARRMKNAGYRTVLVLSQEYEHQHGISIGKSVKNVVARQKMREDSVMYYFRHYLHIGKGKQLIAKIWFGLIRAETILGQMAKGLSGIQDT